MYDNKVRLSQDILEKAQAIADEWGLKNSRAAVEAVFRRYSDDYLYGRTRGSMTVVSPTNVMTMPTASAHTSQSSGCEALDELDDLLAM